MPYRKEQFFNGEIFHITTRAIDDNLIFKNTDDYYRGIFSIYEFNNAKAITIRECRIIRKRIKELEKNNRDRVSVTDLDVNERDKLVEIFAFCFMPNHIHLLLKQLKDNGITDFMKKVGIGYGGYFNRKYQRKGYVFQNRFKCVHIKNENQLKIIFTYIHTNPISLIQPNWKEKGVDNSKEVIKFLENYKWSSYSDYIGNKNFPSVADRDFIIEVMGGIDGCKISVEDWVKYKEEIRQFPNILLD